MSPSFPQAPAPAWPRARRGTVVDLGNAFARERHAAHKLTTLVQSRRHVMRMQMAKDQIADAKDSEWRSNWKFHCHDNCRLSPDRIRPRMSVAENVYVSTAQHGSPERRTRRTDTAMRFHGSRSISGDSTFPSGKRTAHLRMTLTARTVKALQPRTRPT